MRKWTLPCLQPFSFLNIEMILSRSMISSLFSIVGGHGYMLIHRWWWSQIERTNKYRSYCSPLIAWRQYALHRIATANHVNRTSQQKQVGQVHLKDPDQQIRIRFLAEQSINEQRCKKCCGCGMPKITQNNIWHYWQLLYRRLRIDDFCRAYQIDSEQVKWAGQAVKRTTHRITHNNSRLQTVVWRINNSIQSLGHSRSTTTTSIHNLRNLRIWHNGQLARHPRRTTFPVNSCK